MIVLTAAGSDIPTPSEGFVVVPQSSIVFVVAVIGVVVGGPVP